jgi:hypothetical protein
MADERCVFPGDAESHSGAAAGRTPGRWLNAETAERLLRGESLDNAVEPAARDEAERLAKTLGALSVDPPSSAELPGEAAALAAFRKVRVERGAALTASGTGARAAGAHAVDAGLVRIGAPGHRAPRPRRGRGRPVRFGLAAALAFGMAGGVAVAAGTGMLPFSDDEPGPGVSASAAASSDRPLSSPSPEAGIEGEPTPGGSTGGSADPGGSRDDAGGGESTAPGSDGDSRPGGFGTWWNGAASACRDVRDGKTLSSDQRRDLEGFAGGSTHVWKYCKDILANTSASRDTDGQSGQDGRQDSGSEQDDNGGQGSQGGDDESHHGAPGGRGNDHRQNGGFSTPSPTATPSPGSSDAATLLPRHAATSPAPSPSPSYSTL